MAFQPTRAAPKNLKELYYWAHNNFVSLGAGAGGAGTVTSVAVSGSDGIEVDSGSPITTAGTIALGVNAAGLRTFINVEDGATADQTDAEIETAYNNQVAVVSQAEAEAGVATTVRRWTAERVAQAIAALAGGGGSGRTLLATITNPVSGEFDFSSFSAAYRNLELELEIRADTPATDFQPTRIYFNSNITDADYLYQTSFGRNGTSIFGDGLIGNLGRCPAALSPSNSYANITAKIQNYASVGRTKTVLSQFVTYYNSGNADVGFIGTVAHTLSAAVTRIQIRANTFPTDKLLGEARLYGVN